MMAILFLLAVCLGSVAFLFRSAHEQLYFGAPWAVDVCSASSLFCNHPEYLAYAAGVAVVLALGSGIGRALSGD